MHIHIEHACADQIHTLVPIRAQAHFVARLRRARRKLFVIQPERYKAVGKEEQSRQVALNIEHQRCLSL